MAGMALLVIGIDILTGGSESLITAGHSVRRRGILAAAADALPTPDDGERCLTPT
jgi:hypothetical protein